MCYLSEIHIYPMRMCICIYVCTGALKSCKLTKKVYILKKSAFENVIESSIVKSPKA